MILKSMGVGAYVGEIWTGILMFADDIILLAETKNDLEMMINKTNTFLKERKLSLNPSKCNYIVFTCLIITKKIKIKSSTILSR